MLPDWVSKQGPLTYESGALLIALRGPAQVGESVMSQIERDNREYLMDTVQYFSRKIYVVIIYITVFQSYQQDGKVIIIGNVPWTSYFPPTAALVNNGWLDDRVTYWASSVTL